jgi:hypothetical protein
MTATKQPSKRSVPIKSVATGGEPPILTRPESAYLAAYRAMDHETQEEAIRMMEALARGFPRGPRLRPVPERST